MALRKFYSKELNCNVTIMFENLRQLSFNEHSWRVIHNALSVYQCTLPVEKRADVQMLMDHIRDNAIATLQSAPLPKIANITGEFGDALRKAGYIIIKND